MNFDKTQYHLKMMLSEGLGLDLTDPNLTDTPSRMAKMYHNEFFAGTKEDFSDFTTFPNDENYNQIVMVDNAHFVSMCSHHFLPFVGKAWFLYIPDKTLVGVSKIPRLIDHYSARPQLQEKLCHQILNRFIDVVQPKGAMLVMRAVHECMACRGARQYSGCGMTSSALYGSFESEATRLEGMSLINMSTKGL